MAKAQRPPPTPDQFIEQILGAPLEYTSADIAQMAGVEADVSRGLWRALGFADVGDERAFTKKDLEALQGLLRLIDKGILTRDHATEIVRSIGQSTARLTEWQSNLIGRTMVERGIVNTSGLLHPTEMRAVLNESRTLKPALEKLMVYAWRRQMAANASRGVAMALSGDIANDVMAVGFADLVGFTRLTRQVPEIELAHIVEEFESGASDVVAGTGARLVKTLGDEVLFVHASCSTVAETAIRLHEMRSGNEARPRMRIGIASGTVINRMGDVFGNTVNRASRLTAMAKPNSIYIDSETVTELEGMKDKFTIKSVRPHRAPGFGLMRAWSLARPK